MAGRNNDGKLHEISEAIGELKATMRAFGQTLVDDRATGSQRHEENRQSMKAIEQRVGTMEETVRPLASTVAAMEPIVAGYAISQWKKAGAVGLAVALLSLIGLFLEKAIGAAITWTVERLLH